MDNTPQSYQNSSDSGYCFDTSHSLFESTPNSHHESTPNFHNLSRKRKSLYFDKYNARKLTDVIESCGPAPPQFSSTLNDSLTHNLEKFHIQAGDGSNVANQKGLTKLPETTFPISVHEDDFPALIKSFKSVDNRKKFKSAPNTPEKQVKSSADFLKKANTNSFIKNYSQINVHQSPLNKEAYGILYPDLPPLEPLRKPLTPQKFKESIEKGHTPAKKCLFATSFKELLKQVVTNYVVMNNILQRLSDGDLYRLSMVSNSFKDAITLDMKACDRYMKYKIVHASVKENYQITPPSSPERENSILEASPGSKNFCYFYSIASVLNKNQSLTKCPRCQKASIVENSIGQCQDLNSCGYIFCKKCDSFANNPKDFKDKCCNARLANFNKSRSHLTDLSNSASDSAMDTTSSFFSSSLNLSLSTKYDSSGFFSGCENITPVRTVKRNLAKSFVAFSENKPRILSSNNNGETAQPPKYQRRTSLLPVIQLEDAKKPAEIMEPSSPPKIKAYAACSKQSKRNLKRLTR